MSICVRITSILFLTLVFFASPVSAQEIIQNYDVNVSIESDGRVGIVEIIQYDFGSNVRHGIYRDLPTLYELETTEGVATFDVGQNIIRVEYGDGSTLPYTSGSYDEGVRLKIGDPDVKVTGLQTYVIEYEYAAAIRGYETYDELNFDAIGTGWDVPIKNAAVTVTYPFDQSRSSEYQFACFVGPAGAGDRSRCDIIEGSGSATFTSGDLFASEGMSVVVGVPKGLIDVQPLIKHTAFQDSLLGKLLALLAVLGLVVWYIGLPLWIAYAWYRYGRDPNVGVAPTAHFDAPQTKSGRPLTPAETGVLLDETVHMRDVMSLIVDLARRGHMKIVEKKKGDFYLEKDTRTTENIKKLPDFEVKLLVDLFANKKSVRLKDAKLVSTVQEVQKKLYKTLEREQFFPHNPESVRTKYIVLAVFAGITFNVPLVLSSLVFGRNMPRKTLLGAREANKAKGLRSFLKSQERQLKFQADEQILFEKFLPYAVAFGVEKVWMERFKDIKLEQPEWYVSNQQFTTNRMMSGLTMSTRSFTSAATPASSSSGFSGGGFSGGGVGGGGGGSW